MKEASKILTASGTAIAHVLYRSGVTVRSTSAAFSRSRERPPILAIT